MPILVFFRQPQVGFGIMKKSLDKLDLIVTTEPEWRSGMVCVKKKFPLIFRKEINSGHARGARAEKSMLVRR